MINAYLDASAIIKLTLAERESLALIDYLSEHDVHVATSVIAEVEVTRTLQRLGVEDDREVALRKIYLLSVDSDVRREAMRIRPLHLRSLDAIHVATAVSLVDEHLAFITYDDRQVEAAQAAGLIVVQPGR